MTTARTLNERGREAATAIGVWLRSKGHLPETIYSSDAARTRETTERIVEALDNTPMINFKDNMYHAQPATLLRVLRKSEGDTIALVTPQPWHRVLRGRDRCEGPGAISAS